MKDTQKGGVYPSEADRPISGTAFTVLKSQVGGRGEAREAGVGGPPGTWIDGVGAPDIPVFC